MLNYEIKYLSICKYSPKYREKTLNVIQIIEVLLKKTVLNDSILTVFILIYLSMFH